MSNFLGYPILDTTLININNINGSIVHNHFIKGSKYTKNEYYFTEGTRIKITYHFKFDNKTELNKILNAFTTAKGKFQNMWARTYKNTYEVFNNGIYNNNIDLKYNGLEHILQYIPIFMYFVKDDAILQVSNISKNFTQDGIIYNNVTFLSTLPNTANPQIERIIYGHFDSDTMVIEFDDINSGVVTLPFIENTPAQYKKDLGL